MILLAGCGDPWPAEGSYFPYVHTPEPGLEPYEEVRFETETWSPEEDPEELALYVQKSVLHRKGAPRESIAHFAAMRDRLPPLGTGRTLSFVGDVMYVGGNWDTFALATAPLVDGDLRIGNLETPTDPAQSTEPGDLGLYAFNAPPTLLDGLPLDVLQLTNNHAMDAGNEGLEATVAEVAARGLVQVGVDTQAQVEDVAFLAYTWGLNVRDVAPTHELHVVPFGHIGDAWSGEDIDLSALAAEVSAARSSARTVVVLVHWGFEYEYYPDPHFLVLAREIVAAGADLVVGQGPHVAQPAEICAVNQPEVVPGIGTCSLRTPDGEPRTAAILYSLGNFGTQLPTLPCQVGLVATVTVDPDVTGLGWDAVVARPGPALDPVSAHQDDPDVAAELDRLRAHLGDGWWRDR